MDEKRKRIAAGLAMAIILSLIIFLFAPLPRNEVNYALTILFVSYACVLFSQTYDEFWNYLKKYSKTQSESKF